MKRTVIRLPKEVIEELDRRADDLRAAQPRERYSGASVMPALISRGLRLTAADKEGRRDMARRAAPPSSRAPAVRGNGSRSFRWPASPETGRVELFSRGGSPPCS